MGFVVHYESENISRDASVTDDVLTVRIFHLLEGVGALPMDNLIVTSIVATPLGFIGRLLV